MKDPKFADVAGFKTRYYETGSGEPLVFVHGGQFGYPSTALDWEPSFDRLAESFHVYAFDKIGQGDSDNPKKDSEYVIDTTVWHTYEFLRTVGIEKAHLAGHSRGGYTVCRLALEHPEVVRSVIIVDSGTLMPTSPQNWYEERDKKAVNITDPRQNIRFMKETNSYSYSHITDKWLDDTLRITGLANFKKAAAKAKSLKQQFMNDMDKRVTETQEWIREGLLKTPTLVIWGYSDPSANLDPAGLDCMNLILPNVDKSQMVILNDAGHYGFREQTNAFVEAVKGFIESV